MNRRWIGIGLLLTAAWTAAAQPLRARWGSEGAGVMRVLGVDGSGRVRLVPEEHPDGEALVPVSEARGLRFLLPDDYRRARQLAQGARAGEAVLLLRRIVPALVPYAGVPESNAGPAVRLYFRLLVQEQQWADALALSLALDPELAGRDYAVESAALARGLQVARRWDELRLVLERWWVPPPGAQEVDSRHAIELMADELRQGGQWAEAAVLVQKLRAGTSGETQRRYDLLLAYLDWHRGSDLGAQAALRVAETPPAATDLGALYRLLQGRLALQAGETQRALDVLAAALVGAGSTSEWRIELIALLAQAYRENGDEETAAHIAADLRRQVPDSRWLAELGEETTL